MKIEDLLPESVYVYLPEPGTPGCPTGDVRLEVAVGDVLMPGQKVGLLEQLVGLPSGNLLTSPSEIYYHDCYEAQVDQIMLGTQTGDPILRLKPLRLVANYICAELAGDWHCEIKGYWDKMFNGEEIFIEPGEHVGLIHRLDDPSEHIPVIYEGETQAKVLHIFTDGDFVSGGDHLLLYQIVE